MATWSLDSIDEAAFLRFCNDPTDTQIERLCGLLPTYGFEADAETDLSQSVRRRLSSDDWYIGFEQSNMYAWEYSIGTVLNEPEFKRHARGHHCAVSDVFIEMAANIFAERGIDAVVRNFWPYRFTDSYGPASDGYYPSSALIENSRLKRLLLELENYDVMLDEYHRSHASYVDSCRGQIACDLLEAIPVLEEMSASGRMWFATKDQ